LKTNELISVQIDRSGRRGKGRNDQLLGSGGQRSHVGRIAFLV